MGATRRNLPAQHKILKKLSEHQYTKQNENFPKKTMFRTLKVLKSRKFVWEVPDGICRLNPKSSIMIETPNQNKNFPKKVCLVN
jgi:hypothetical protein